VLSKLSLHPNIISYYDSFEVDGTLMIEMEYADGGSVFLNLGTVGLCVESFVVCGSASSY